MQYPCHASLPQAPPKPEVAEHQVETGCQRYRITRRNKKAGLAVDDGEANAADR